jgi:hypothetical protein
MRSITTGAGLAILGACVLGAAAISSSKGGQAMAQTGSERRIVNVGCFSYQDDARKESYTVAYRCWSDGIIEQRKTGRLFYNTNDWASSPDSWIVIDNGQTPSVQPSDTNTDGSVDAADLGKVLLDYGATQQVTPAPTIDCQTSTIP